MPIFIEHEAHAASNLAFVDEIFKLSDDNGLRFPDWYATVCFYTAVHVIEAEIYQMATVYYNFNAKPMALTGKIRHSSDFKLFLGRTTLPTSPHFYRRLVVDDRRENREYLAETGESAGLNIPAKDAEGRNRKKQTHFRRGDELHQRVAKIRLTPAF